MCGLHEGDALTLDWQDQAFEKDIENGPPCVVAWINCWASHKMTLLVPSQHRNWCWRCETSFPHWRSRGGILQLGWGTWLSTFVIMTVAGSEKQSKPRRYPEFQRQNWIFSAQQKKKFCGSHLRKRSVAIWFEEDKEKKN